MAKNRSKIVGKSKKVMVKRKTKQTVAQTGDTLDSHAIRAAAMYSDPCGAELAPSVYPGERGYVNRFVQNQVLGTAGGSTALAWVIKPGNALSFPTELPLPSTSVAIGWGNGVAGNAFLVANSSKQRCVGYCVDIRPNSAPNTATGTIHFGVGSASSFPNGVNTTVNDIIAMCSESVSCSQAVMAPLSVKWCPGSLDDRYSPTWTAGFFGDDDSDRNVLIIAATGYPAGTGLQFRFTALYEWVPRLTLGVIIDATATKPSRCDKECVLRNLKRKDPEWWFSIGKKTFNVARQLTSGYFTGGVIGAMGAAAKFM